ncbi:putative glycerol-1-phosphate prenyltransferase [Thermonema lapsum]|uniref:Geranylgeranylglyceryl phosphate synthase n=1 Tax=Thermonema lapsum TaxID=28195 RepID=A0A846MPZ3_9BACT|nr:geranylgeranylglyceryl/heptaprenylglyceryl phosphate synthase [Thermonema lapsum]NIK73430.1 putative glycerol-1-phosphate prenyltransferase [Thermonema lapsum]
MVFPKIQALQKEGQKALAVLIDPDDTDHERCQLLAAHACKAGAHFFFVGGSLIVSDRLHHVIEWIRNVTTHIPIVLFPGSNLHIDSEADAILFLSLISGRNPDYLIGQHVLAAPILKRSGLEVISTGYMLIDSGAPTTVTYISNTTPIPQNKGDIAACTAMAGEMLGMRIIYMDAGSGASQPISPAMIRKVRKAISAPLIVGGGIRSALQAQQAWNAGADIVVVGNAFEENPRLVYDMCRAAEYASNDSLKKH